MAWLCWVSSHTWEIGCAEWMEQAVYASKVCRLTDDLRGDAGDKMSMLCNTLLARTAWLLLFSLCFWLFCFIFCGEQRSLAFFIRPGGPHQTPALGSGPAMLKGQKNLPSGMPQLCLFRRWQLCSSGTGSSRPVGCVPLQLWVCCSTTGV